MADSRYWQSRITRRRWLTVAGGAAASTAFLAACGGSSSNDQGSGAGSNAKGNGLLTPIADTTKTATRGGIMKDRTFSDVPTLSVSTGGSNPHNAVGPLVYNSLLQFKPGYLKPTTNELGPDLVESWETSPDGLTVTLKLRQGVKWQNKAPINGRAFDMDDVMQTWNFFSKSSGVRSNVVNSVNPSAPVLSLAPSDSRTLVMKLAEPVIYALEFFASANASSGLAIPPRESYSTFDSKQDMIGTGPYMLDRYTPSVGFTFKRNPDYWDKDETLVDQIEMPIITEYAATLAQFKAGNIYSFGSYSSAPKITAEDIIPTIKDNRQIALYEGDMAYPAAIANGRRVLAFGWLPEGKTPIVDQRVRQAMSMSWDRDLYLDVLFNISNFAKEGLTVDARWDSHVAANLDGWWLDPKGKDFGDNSMYFKHNPAEAKKLLASAGYANGFDTLSNYVTGPELPTSKHAEILDGFFSEIGVRTKVTPIDYAKEYQPKFRDGQGQFEGYAYMTNVGSGPVKDATAVLATEFWSPAKAASFKGFSVNGKNDKSGDPQVDAMIGKARLEHDVEKRRAMVYDLQRYLAKAMYSLSPPGTARTFQVAWPCIGNYQVFQSSRPSYKLWVDPTKPPLKG